MHLLSLLIPPAGHSGTSTLDILIVFKRSAHGKVQELTDRLKPERRIHDSVQAHRSSVNICLVIAALSLILISVHGAVDQEERVYKDKSEDVIRTSEKRDLSRMIDLEEIEGDKSEILQVNQIDIRKLTIRGNDTYVSFSMETLGEISDQKGISYIFSGYATDDPRSTDPFDFKLVYSSGNASHLILQDGNLIPGPNVSSFEINGTRLTITMNRGRFILSDREDPFTVAAITLLDPGPGEDQHMDHALSNKKDDGSKPFIDETTLIMLEFIILGFAFITVIIVWNVYMKRKGEENQGGICPRCESKLDPNLDFCPSCGTFIRGPKARSKKQRPGLVAPPEEE
jgi:hypothetical protein